MIMLLRTNKGANHATGNYYIQADGKDIFNITLDEMRMDSPNYDPELAHKFDLLFDEAVNLGKEMVKSAVIDLVG